MTSKVKRIRLAILFFSIGIFLLYLFPNSHGAADTHILSLTSQDESFQYPFLLHMLTMGETPFETLKNIVSYHHYIYGYPFYLASWLVSLPLLIIYGSSLGSHAGPHLLVLRQLISVLPMITSIFILVHLQTGFRSWRRSLGLFIFLSLIPGVVRQSINWWHPDALAILFAVLTIHFLMRDRFRFGRDLNLAALFCGLSTGTKLIGVFFVFVIAGYLIAGYWRKILSLQSMFSRGFLFIAIFLATAILSNPLLLITSSRQDIIQTHIDHNLAFREGWQATAEYQTGPLSWLPVLGRWYGGLFCFILAFAINTYWIVTGRNRLLNTIIIGWTIPFFIYLFFIISVRPDHYWLPIILPLYSSILTSTETQLDHSHPDTGIIGEKKITQIFSFLLSVFLIIQTGFFLKTDSRLITDAITQDAVLTACDSNPSNGTDGTPFRLENGRWYLIRSFDILSDPRRYEFKIVEGNNLNQVQAFPQAGQLAFACVDEQRAELRAIREARDTKLTNPSALVIGPDANEVPRNP
jgi:hypothetical protein